MACLWDAALTYAVEAEGTAVFKETLTVLLYFQLRDQAMIHKELRLSPEQVLKLVRLAVEECVSVDEMVGLWVVRAALHLEIGRAHV